MTPDAVEAKVREILSTKFNIPPEKITAETRLAEDLGIDSFGAVELLFEVEEAFGLKIPDAEIEHVRKVGDVVAYLQEWLKKSGRL